MASKIKEGLKELKDNALNAIRGPKYHGNLLGESLYDKMRQATSKTLLEPNTDLNQQVRVSREQCAPSHSSDRV